MAAQGTMCFVWSITINADDLFGLPNENIMKAWLGQMAKQWVFQKEQGAQGRMHYQCNVNLKKKNRTTWIVNQWAEETGCPKTMCTARRVSTAGGKKAFKYCMKEDTRVAGPWADKPIYQGQDLACMATPYPWQQKILDIITGEPDDRTLYWVYNAAGNVGKSKLLKYLKYKEMAVRVPMGTSAQLRCNTVAKGAHRCYVVDIPRMRGKEDSLRDLFSALEEIKNGWVESAMYGKDACLMMAPPHVIIVSNDKPNLTYASEDRWVVFQVGDDLELRGL